MVGTVLICGGTLMAVLTAGYRPRPCRAGPTKLRGSTWGDVNSELYLSYLALSVVSALFLHCVHKRYDKAFTKGTPLDTCAGVDAAFSAIFGAQSVVQAKCLAILILYYVDRSEPGGLGFGNMFLNYWTYDHVTTWVFFVAVWLYRMNEALGLYDPIFIIPLLQAGFIIFAIISALLWEFSRSSRATGSLAFCFGIFFVCVGLPLSPKDPSSQTAGHTFGYSYERPEGGEPRRRRSTSPRSRRAVKTVAVARRVAQGPSSLGDRPSSRPVGSLVGRRLTAGIAAAPSHVAVTSVASSHNREPARRDGQGSNQSPAGSGGPGRGAQRAEDDEKDPARDAAVRRPDVRRRGHVNHAPASHRLSQEGTRAAAVRPCLQILPPRRRSDEFAPKARRSAQTTNARPPGVSAVLTAPPAPGRPGE